jgi:hypothetical protein
MSRIIKGALVVGLCFSFLTMGCIGQMGVSGKVRQFNVEATEDRWGREILFVIMMVIPIYAFASLADVIVFNSIEFWSGTNPINGKDAVTPVAALRSFDVDGTAVSMTLRDDQSIDVEAFTPDGERHFFNLIRTEQGVAARNRVGEILARAPQGDAQLARLLSTSTGS